MARERGREKMRTSAGLPLAAIFLAGVALLASSAKGIEEERRSMAAPPLAPPPIVIEPPPPQNPSSIVVEGVIYCRCKLPGYERAVDGAPVRGAVVLLRCSSGRNAQVTVKGRTDKHGYFYLQAPLRSKYRSARRCRVFVLSSPVRACTVPRQYGLSGGGASPVFERRLGQRLLFSAGFLELGPTKSTKCYL